ncbi:hypothetical protein [Sphaerisporangium aureirubrum]|uniref:DUF8094 domain-containing protein n=1 Tax=Sphaerisporangium aureirubrum TaxID=1544736 RepID=A0ABW1NBT1_9ACTN
MQRRPDASAADPRAVVPPPCPPRRPAAPAARRQGVPFRLAALGVGLVLLAGCGSQSDIPPAPTVAPTAAGSGSTVGTADAGTAFGVLKELDDAWKAKDCAKVLFLTTAAENELGGRGCEATRNGRPVPSRPAYGDTDFFLPDRPQEHPWFVALARDPDPVYVVLVQEDSRWRVAYGPLKLLTAPPKLDADVTTRVVPTEDPDDGVRARLVPQKHLAFLSDRAGLTGIRFASGDPMRSLLTELVKKPTTVRPDRLSSEIQLIPDDTRALALAGGGALVFHSFKIFYTQKTTAGKLSHPLFGTTQAKAFTDSSTPKSLHATEIVQLATKVTPDGKLTTIASSRALADLTP